MVDKKHADRKEEVRLPVSVAGCLLIHLWSGIEPPFMRQSPHLTLSAHSSQHRLDSRLGNHPLTASQSGYT